MPRVSGVRADHRLVHGVCPRHPGSRRRQPERLPALQSLYDNPHPLIVPAANLQEFNRQTVARLCEAYYAIPEEARPFLEEVWPHDRGLSQSERFEDRLTIVKRLVELWEDGQFVGWPS